MKLFFYYIFHSAKNSLKKLFKTWVLVFIAVMLVGGLVVGFTIGRFLKSALPDETEEPGIEQQDPDWQDPQDEVPIMDILELAAGGVILLMFTLGVMGADKSGAEIFHPADVNLLFPSPMQPQSVLLFRTMTQIGASIAVSIYFLAFQVPNLMQRAKLGIGTALVVAAGWILMLCITQLLKMLCFVTGSTRPAFKRNLRRIVYAVLCLVGAGFYAFKMSSGLGWWEAVLAFFNAPQTRYIPFWGWIKGFVMFAAEHNTRGALVCLAATLIGGALMAWLIWHMKADFYEEAMQRAAEKAELLAAAQDAESGGLIQRKKDRSEKIRRNQFDRGRGATVFFWKAVYNRFRFAHFGFLTKTMEFYLVTCIAAALICRLAVQTESYIPLVVMLAVFTFYRSLGNSLKQDTQMWYFHMIPEDPWLKLLCSLGGDLMNCFLDTLPALIIGLLIQGAPLLPALIWFPAIISVTAYATSVGTFLDMSINLSGGKTLKQMIQVVFLYFGLLPDLALGGILVALKLPLLAALAVVLINTALTFLFLLLASLNMGRK